MTIQISRSAQRCTKKTNAFTLVEVMIVVAVIAVLAAIAIPNLLRARVSAHEAAAQAKLRSISTALENYASINDVYPSTMTALLAITPPYLNKNYFVGTHEGYTFTPSLSPSGYDYAISAIPASTNQGTKTFTINTGGILSQE